MFSHKKDTQQRWIDLVIFTGILCFFAYSLFRLQGSKPAKARGLASVTQEELQRVTAQSTSSKAKSKVEHIHFDCTNEKKIKTTNASLVRLSLVRCPSSKATFTGSNQDTGEEIQVFTQNKGLTTHYFHLKNGVNHVHLLSGRQKIAIQIDQKLSE